MTNPSDTFRKFLHRLGVAGPARVRACQGSRMSSARRLALATLATLSATTGFALVGTSASALETHSFISSFSGSLTPEGAELFAPVGIAANASTGKVYVSSHGTHKSAMGFVDVFSSSGVYESQLTEADGATPFPFTDARGLTVDQSTGAVYVVESVENVIDVFNAAGVYQSQIDGAGVLGNDPFSVAVDDATGEVYVAASGPDRVYVFSSAGALLEEWTGIGTPAGSFGHSAVSVAVDQTSHDVYVADNEHGVVDKLEPSGGYLSQLTQADGVTPFAFGHGLLELSVDASGDVDVTDTDIGAVDEFGPSDSFVAEVRGTPSGPFRRLGEAVAGSGGELYATETAAEPAAVDIFASAIVVLPDVTTDAASGVAKTSVTLNGAVNADGEGKASCQFDYGTSTSFGKVAPCPAEVEGGSPVEVHVPVTVQPATTYYYRLQASNKNGTNLGESSQDQQFTTPPAVDAVNTGSAQEVTAGGATLTGSLAPDGIDAHYYFQYGATTEYGSTSPAPPGTDAGTASASVPAETTIGGLAEDTTYHYRLVAVNADGTTYGEDQELTTLGPGIEASVSDVASTSATFEASVNPRGAPTRAYVEYGRCETPATCSSNGYEHRFPAPPGEALGGGGEPVALAPWHVQGLVSGATYHYRAVTSSELDRVHEPGKLSAFVGPEAVFTTQTVGSFALPDDRQWEMVSPPSKQGALIEGTEAPRVEQASSAGGAITYFANVPTELGAAGSAHEIQILSVRGSHGWTSRDIAPPHDRATGSAGGSGAEYRFFSEDLSVGILQPFGAFTPSISPEASEQTAFLHTDFLNGNPSEVCTSGCYHPLVAGCPAGRPCSAPVAEHANVPPGTIFGEEGTCPDSAGTVKLICGPGFVGATPDAEHIVLQSEVALTSTPIKAGALYEWTAGRQLALVSVLPTAEGGTAASYAQLGFGNQRARHVISNDGTRVIWEGVNNLGEQHLYMSDMATGTAQTVRLDAPEQGTVAGSPGPIFQLASADGSRVLFTDSQHLTSDSGAGESEDDLYECEMRETVEGLKCVLSDLTPVEENTPMASSVIGASEDASWVYFVADGILRNSGQRVSGAVKGGDNLYNLYVLHDGTVKLVAVLSVGDSPDWGGGAGAGLYELIGRVSPNGQWLAFMSDRELTHYDNRDAVTGAADEEAFLYDAQTGRLACVSCQPTGARPVGQEYGVVGSNMPVVGGITVWGAGTSLSADLPAWISYNVDNALYEPRYLSNSGRMFFNSYNALVPQDTNGTWDVYEYEPQGVGPEGAQCGSGVTGAGEVYRPARSFEVEGRSGEEGAGCVGLISSGSSHEETAFFDADETGSEVFFLTSAQLTPQDHDNAFDIYDAHECTTASPCVPPPAAQPPECATADACRAAPVPQPTIFGAPASATFNGLGNVTPPAPPPAKKVAKKAVKCPKGHVKNRKGRCVKKEKSRRSAHRSAKGRK